ncbi:MAG: hypothetical protein JWQ83_465 [Lacunisphaera sp.]|nr:hypothetical protein [Lacunisphaera sp.]MDB6165325.1 hypothetical protein [Lacunisphaera sp.]
MRSTNSSATRGRTRVIVRQAAKEPLVPSRMEAIREKTKLREGRERLESEHRVDETSIRSAVD